MSDIIDLIQEQEEIIKQSLISNTRKTSLPYTGFCYNCNEPTEHMFCDCDCRYDYEARERQRKQKL